MCIKCNFTNELSQDYLAGLPAAFKKAMQDLYDGKITPEDLSPQLLTLMANELWQGVDLGISQAPAVADFAGIKAIMQQNVFVFSGFKTYQQLKEASMLMLDENNQLKPFTRFYKDVTAINKTYNVNYLNAEYNHSVAAAQMAAHWHVFEANKDFAPNLQYITAHDDRVRDSHRVLDKVTRPIDDKFWDTYYPPNGHNCRCHVSQPLHNSPPITTEFETPTIPPMFRNNVGKTGVLFPNTHPYFDVCSGITRVVKNSDNCQKRKDKIKSRSLSSMQSALNIERKNAIYKQPVKNQYEPVATTKSGYLVNKHLLTNIADNDYLDKLELAKHYSELMKTDAYLLPEIHQSEISFRDKIMPGAVYPKNPDIKLSDTYIEMKRSKSVRNISARIRKAAEQANHVAIVLKNKANKFEIDTDEIFDEHKELNVIDIFDSEHKLIAHKIRKERQKTSP